MFRLPRMLVAVGTLAAALIALPAQAGVIVGGTRVVFPAKIGEVSVRLENKGSQPALVQAWLDTGDAAATPDTVKVPFTLTPPIFRMEPEKGQALRMIHSGEDMATDRETLFWLNVLEVPPKPEIAEGTSTLQFAFRNRIKVFYRPHGLAYPVTEAPSKLQWSLAPGVDGMAIRVFNPSPYHVSFNKIALTANGRTYEKREVGGGMVTPGGTADFPLADLPAHSGAAEVVYSTIDDYGAHRAGTALIAP